MNLIYFIRLLLKNVFLIVGIGILMAVMVYVMTRNQPETYTSQMEVYTGLATGYNIESGSDFRYDLFGTNAKFDNLLNIIRSRQTQEETAIRLMAQHLMLEQPDARYCNTDTWNALHKEVPPEVKALVHYDPGYLRNQGYDIQKQSVNNDVTSGNSDDKVDVQAKESGGGMETRQVTKKAKKYRTKPKY